MRYPVLLGSGAAVVLGVAFLMGREGTVPGTRTDSSAQQPDFGYVALDAQVTQTTDEGVPLYTLVAARVEQDTGSGDLSAHTLTMHYGIDPAQRWTLGAREGQMPAGGTLIHLQGDVQVQGKPPGSSHPAQINSQRLDFDTQTEDVSTPLPVLILWSGLQLNSLGLTANLKQDHVSLESSVHGRFSH